MQILDTVRDFFAAQPPVLLWGLAGVLALACGAVAPIGGLAFIAGWVFLAIAALKRPIG